MTTVGNQISFALEAIGHFMVANLSVVFLLIASLLVVAMVIPLYDHQPFTLPPSTDVSQDSDKIVTHDPGVHVFPTKDFPQRLAEFIDNNRQTIVVSVCPYYANANKPGVFSEPNVLASQPTGYLVVTRPDPEWLKILPGSQAPPPTGRQP